MFVLYEDNERLSNVGTFHTLKEAETAKKLIENYKRSYTKGENSIFQIEEIKIGSILDDTINDICYENNIDFQKVERKILGDEVVDFIHSILGSPEFTTRCIDTGDEKVALIYTM